MKIIDWLEKEIFGRYRVFRGQYYYPVNTTWRVAGMPEHNRPFKCWVRSVGWPLETEYPYEVRIK